MSFTEEPQHFVDVDGANFNTSHRPASPFVRRPVVVRKDSTSVRRLLGREYSVERPGEPIEKRELTDDEFADLLRSDFGPRLTEARSLPWLLGMSEIERLAVIIGSVRKDRIGPTVAAWFLDCVRAGTDAIVVPYVG